MPPLYGWVGPMTATRVAATQLSRGRMTRSPIKNVTVRGTRVTVRKRRKLLTPVRLASAMGWYSTDRWVEWRGIVAVVTQLRPVAAEDRTARRRDGKSAGSSDEGFPSGVGTTLMVVTASRSRSRSPVAVVSAPRAACGADIAHMVSRPGPGRVEARGDPVASNHAGSNAPESCATCGRIGDRIHVLDGRRRSLKREGRRRSR